MTNREFCIGLLTLCAIVTSVQATVSVSPLFGNNMVVQRDKNVPVYGTAAPGATVTVSFNSQVKDTVADAQGNWAVKLDSMAADTTGRTLTITETGANTLTIQNVVVGDVWLCSGQSNMDFWLNGCERPADISGANFPGIRYVYIPVVGLEEPTKDLNCTWQVCSPSVAGSFSAVPFYFGRKIYQEQGTNIPIGLIKSVQGGTTIDVWLAPEGASDIPGLQPLYSQNIVPWGPFFLFNGMMYPLEPFGIRGVIWYQGEYGEASDQGPDSYYWKEKALVQGWRRLWGEPELPFYVVQLANLNNPPANATPETGGWPLIRDFQKDMLEIAYCGMASALDVGEANDIHPKDKFDVGERLALWALKNEYGQSALVPSGPILKDVTVAGNALVCSFDYVGAGLMVGSKTPYLPTEEVIGGTLQRFSIAAANGTWYAADAVISGETVVVSSSSVATPRKIAYAYWINPEGANLYNKDGLPASPFYVGDVTVKHPIVATAGLGGSISPAGTNAVFTRMTAGYTITPDTGYYIGEVSVDGAPVGALNTFTFDPVYDDHTIAATFSTNAPVYSINASATMGGTISPAGTVNVTQGLVQTFTIVADSGTHIAGVTVDGAPVGRRSSFTFSDVRNSHEISAAFASTIAASAGYGGKIEPNDKAEVIHGENQTFTFTPIAGYAVEDVTVDGVSAGMANSYTFTNVTTDHTIAVSFRGTESGTVPEADKILFSCLADTLPASGGINSWVSYIPAGKTLTKIGSPTVEIINGHRFEKNIYADGDGFTFGTYSSAIPCSGVSIVVAVRPLRNAVRTGWTSIVDVFYDRILLGVLADEGQVCVRRNGSLDYSETTLPEGQVTILSIVVQANGTYKVYANGVQVMQNTGTSAMTSLVPGVAGTFAKSITVGRNAPDGWTTFNGNIGDVFLYTTALSETERRQVERFIANKLAGGHTISATAGPGGSISPSGDVVMNAGADQQFSITVEPGSTIADVTVDGISQGVISTYTFNDVNTNHTIAVEFIGAPYVNITNAVMEAEVSAAVSVAGTNNSFVVGTMWVSNGFTGERIEFPAAAAWLSPAVVIEESTNTVYVFGSNVVGMIASDSIQVVGVPEGGSIVCGIFSIMVGMRRR